VPPSEADAPAGASLAVAAQALYLANLLIAPGLAFLALGWLRWRRRPAASPLARAHLDQAWRASLLVGLLLVLVVSAVVFAFGPRSGWTWVVVILYVTFVHSSFVLIGVVGLARAMAGRPPWVLRSGGARASG
jgi:hypothetical protein